MAHLYIIRGPSGAGKTTLAGTLYAAEFVDAYFEADMWRGKKNGQYVYDPADNERVHAACLAAVRAALSAGEIVAVANVFRTVAHMQPYLDYCAEHGHMVTVIRVEGAFQDVHGVAEAAKAFMRANFENYPKELS